MVILVFKFGGRLGNRLLAFAHLIAFSKTYNVSVRYPAFDEYASYFKGTADNVHCAFPKRQNLFVHNNLRLLLYAFNKAVVRPLIYLKLDKGPIHKVVHADLPHYSFLERRFMDMNDDSFVNLSKRTPLVFLNGRFFRAYENVEVHQDAIRSFFKPVDRIQKIIDQFFKDNMSDTDITVGVHRRGRDYRDFAGGRYYYSQEQYCQKLYETQDLFPNKRVRFVICSDDPIDVFLYPEVSVVAGPGGVVEDMYTLAKCDYIIGAPSTYSLWASFYGNKPICQLWSMDTPLTLDNFKILPKEVLFNYSFN